MLFFKTPHQTTHWLPRTQTLQEVCVCTIEGKISIQKHFPRDGKMNIEFGTDVVLLTCPGLAAARLVFTRSCSNGV